MELTLPKEFILGVSTSAHQIEGNLNRGKCIWDMSKRNIANHACNSYSKYKEDIAIMKLLGIKHYRMSISWCRLLPYGHIEIVSSDAVKYYNNLIDELVANGITPYITLYHWDLPLTLYEEYEGWLTSKVIEDFLDYADLCFSLFSDRVRHWFTFNEPWCIAILGYCIGNHAPCHSRAPGVEPYLVAHNILLAHAKTVELFRRKYKGMISIALNSPWWEPLTEHPKDREACQKAMCFSLDWFLDPILYGDYPDVMKSRVGNRLPLFREEEKELIKGSIDFLSINHYFTLFGGKNNLGRMLGNVGKIKRKLLWDTVTKSHYFKDMGAAIADVDMPQTDMGWYVYPRGMRELLKYCKIKTDLPIYITENGMSMEGINDEARINYIANYLDEVSKAINEGVNVKAYFLWSLIDNFEWNHNYTKCFGIITRDRKLKESAHWYSTLCKQYTYNN